MNKLNAIELRYRMIPVHVEGMFSLLALQMEKSNNQGLGSSGSVYEVVNPEDEIIIPSSGLFVREDFGGPLEQSEHFKVWGAEGSGFVPVVIRTEFASYPDALEARVALLGMQAQVFS